MRQRINALLFAVVFVVGFMLGGVSSTSAGKVDMCCCCCPTATATVVPIDGGRAPTAFPTETPIPTRTPRG